MRTFLTPEIEKVLDLLKEKNIWSPDITQIHGTGGGSFKYKELIEQKLEGAKVVNHDEIKSLVDGMSFVIENG